MLNPRLVRRMKRLGLIASVQPHFVVSDFWVVDRVGGERARWVYAFKTLVREGMVVLLVRTVLLSLLILFWVFGRLWRERVLLKSV